MSYVALPYLLKFLWAPFVDRFPLPLLGRRRGWILVTQLLLAVAIALFALQNPAAALLPVAVCAVAIVFLSATQDIAVDAYRTDVSLPSERGPAAAATNLGYRTAAWFASAVALLMADYFGWRLAFLLLAGVMTLFCIATWLAPEPPAIQQPPRSLRETVVIPLQELLAGPGAAALLGVVLLFKIGDAFAMKLFTPFMLDIGFSKTELAVIVKGLFTGGALFGSVLGGILMVRLGLLRSMLIFGISQAVTNLLYCALAAAGKSYPLMVAAVVIEHVAGAMGNIALVALIMALCDVRYSAFQYALMSSIALLPRYGLGYPAGWVADHGGWYVYYVVSFVVAMPGLLIVWLARHEIEALDQRRAMSEPRQIDVERVICRFDDLGESGARGFAVGSGDWPLRGFVVRINDTVRGYINSCPHARHPLNLRPHRFLTPDAALILCSSHGALFEKLTGYCVAGPCAGQSLQAVPLKVESGFVMLADEV